MIVFSRLKLLLLSCNIVLFSIFSCRGLNPCHQEELYRKICQDNVVDVVVLKKDCGATTSTSNIVYIVASGDLIKGQSPIFIADHIKDLEVKWVKPKLLMISYAEARIFNFTNFWHSKDVDNFRYEVTIREFQTL